MTVEPTLPPPTEQDLLEAAKTLETGHEPYETEGQERVAQFLRLLAPRMAMFASMLPPTQ